MTRNLAYKQFIDTSLAKTQALCEQRLAEFLFYHETFVIKTSYEQTALPSLWYIKLGVDASTML
jgi:hypothetical protein